MNCIYSVVTPVNESMVKKEYGIIGWTLHWWHGAIHKDVQSIMHGALAQNWHAGLWICETCSEKRKLRISAGGE